MRQRRTRPVTPAEKHAERVKRRRERSRRYERKHRDERNKKRRDARRLVITSYSGLAEVAKDKRDAMGLSQLAFDDQAGLTPGHVGKLEIGAARGRGWGRFPGIVGTSVWFDTLGLTLRVVGCDGVAISEEKKRGEYTGKLVMRIAGVQLEVVE